MTAVVLLAEAIEETGFNVDRSTTQNKGGDPARPLHSRLLKRVQTREGFPLSGRPVPAGAARRTTQGLSAPIFRPQGQCHRDACERNRIASRDPAPYVTVLPDLPALRIDGDVAVADEANFAGGSIGARRAVRVGLAGCRRDNCDRLWNLRPPVATVAEREPWPGRIRRVHQTQCPRALLRSEPRCAA